jgi:ABC-2 type transport system ATP-binding protein
VIAEVDDLWKRYGRFEALQGLRFGIPEGSAFALVGPNGAGKTTTIKVLMNLLTPSRGRASVFGVDSRGRRVSRVLAAALQTLGSGARNDAAP